MVLPKTPEEYKLLRGLAIGYVAHQRTVNQVDTQITSAYDKLADLQRRDVNDRSKLLLEGLLDHLNQTRRIVLGSSIFDNFTSPVQDVELESAVRYAGQIAIPQVKFQIYGKGQAKTIPESIFYPVCELLRNAQEHLLEQDGHGCFDVDITSIKPIGEYYITVLNTSRASGNDLECIASNLSPSSCDALALPGRTTRQTENSTRGYGLIVANFIASLAGHFIAFSDDPNTFTLKVFSKPKEN